MAAPCLAAQVVPPAGRDPREYGVSGIAPVDPSLVLPGPAAPGGPDWSSCPELAYSRSLAQVLGAHAIPPMYLVGGGAGAGRACRPASWTWCLPAQSVSACQPVLSPAQLGMHMHGYAWSAWFAQAPVCSCMAVHPHTFKPVCVW